MQSNQSTRRDNLIYALCPHVVVEIEDTDITHVPEHNGHARRQIRHDAKFGTTSPRIPHMEPQSEKNKKCDSTRDGDVGRALAAPGRERSFELREVRERAECYAGD